MYQGKGVGGCLGVYRPDRNEPFTWYGRDGMSMSGRCGAPGITYNLFREKRITSTLGYGSTSQVVRIAGPKVVGEIGSGPSGIRRLEDVST